MRHSLVVAVAVLSFAVTRAGANDYKVGSLEIASPWARATPKGAHVAGGYVTIRNKGPTPDRLISISASFANRVEIHSMTMDGEVMRMRPMSGGIEIKPGETVELKPGGLHMMFVEPNRPLTPGDHVSATLQFEKAGTVVVDFMVESMGAESPMGHMH